MIFVNNYSVLEGISILILIFILFVIALLHFYWAFGGKWGIDKSVPTKEDGNVLFVPTTFQSAFVGFGLLLITVFFFLGINYNLATSNVYSNKPITTFFPNGVYQNGFYILAFVFFLRAIGDFKYVGFLKKVKKTSFGKLDTRFYSPLCLFIGGVFYWMGSLM